MNEKTLEALAGTEMTCQEVAKVLKANYQAVNNTLKNLMKRGQVVRTRKGDLHVYTAK